MPSLQDVRNRYHRFRNSIAGITRYGNEGIKVGSIIGKKVERGAKRVKREVKPYLKNTERVAKEYSKQGKYKYGNKLDIPRPQHEEGELGEYRHYGKLQPKLSGGGIYDAVTTDVSAPGIEVTIKRRHNIYSGSGGITLDGDVRMPKVRKWRK